MVKQKNNITEKKTPEKAAQVDGILHPLVKKWFYQKFTSFSKPQLFGVNEIHSRNNILISAPTGATKTLTAFLSILNQLVDDALSNRLEDKTYALYISPLKALNNDIHVNLQVPLAEMEEIHGKPLGIRVGLRTGDTTPYHRTKMIKTPPHILITTPESLGLLLANLNFTAKLERLQWVIIDEIHAIANNKRGVQLSLFLEQLAFHSQDFCRVGLSATAEPLETIAQYLVGKRNCLLVRLLYLKETDIQIELPVDNLVRAEYDEIHDKTYERIHELIQEHTSTLIFTNTRSATERIVNLLKTKHPEKYYEINENPPFEKSQLIGAHHGSLSKEHRHEIESKLRAGKLKCVVCSTSLELGIDIGCVDLVILLHSPKSVARLLQRIGRSGHKLGGVAKGRMFVVNRDELMESAVLLSEAKNRHIDAIHIPQNALDVLCQFIIGISFSREWKLKELYNLVCKSYSYSTLSYDSFLQCVHYLADDYDRLERQFVYSKITLIEDVIYPKKRVKLIYLQNIGTITDSGAISVKMGQRMIGSVDESFVESLKPYDVFVLGGDTYKFLYSRGMTIQVSEAGGRSPTVPRWQSQALGTPFDIAQAIMKFKHSPSYTHIPNLKKNISAYLREQKDFAVVPKSNELFVELFADGVQKYTIVHSPLGRKANEAFAIILSHCIRKIMKFEPQYMVSDTGFYLVGKKHVAVSRIIDFLGKENISDVMDAAIDGSQHIKRRFRGVAVRGMLIIPNYKGSTKHVGKQQVKSHMLLGTLHSVSATHPLLVETKREVLEDELDVANLFPFLEKLVLGRIKIVSQDVKVPSPFVHQLFVMAYADVLNASDRQRYLTNLHAMVIGQIALAKNRANEVFDHEPVAIDADFSYQSFWKDDKAQEDDQSVDSNEELDEMEQMVKDVKYICRRLGLDSSLSYELEQFIEGKIEGRSVAFLSWVKGLLSGAIPKIWSDNIVAVLRENHKKV